MSSDLVTVPQTERDPQKLTFALRQVIERISAGRGTLTANRIYYVNGSTGADSNNGRASTTAFATIQKAYDTICNTLDMAGYTAYISVAAGTYTAGVNDALTVGYPIGGFIRIEGDLTTPSNVVINTASDPCFAFGDFNPARFGIGGMKLISGSASLGAITVQGGSQGVIYNLEYGATTGIHLYVHGAGAQLYLVASTNFAISGGAQAHLWAETGGNIITFDTLVYTLTGTPDFTEAFAVADKCGIIEMYFPNITFTGAATGIRAEAATNGVIDTFGTPNGFPGDVANATFTGGLIV